MATVYALALASNPTDFRYIGRTSVPLPRRLQNHLSKARTGSSTYVYRWVKKAIDEGEIIQIVELESGLTFKESGVREIYWIKYYREAGHRLTNTSNGGDGNIGYIKTPEHRAKLSAAGMGNTNARLSNRIPGQGLKISLARGVPKSLEHREKISRALTGKIVSEETKAKMSRSAKGNTNAHRS